jgi:hypothetical protein
MNYGSRMCLWTSRQIPTLSDKFVKIRTFSARAATEALNFYV